MFDTVGDDAGLWPELLPRLRSRSGLSLRDVAAQLLTRFGSAPARPDRTTDYLGRLERGELEPARVSRRLLDALGETLGAGGATLRDAATFGQGVPVAPAAGGALFRGDADAGDQVADDIARLSRLAMRERPRRWTSSTGSSPAARTPRAGDDRAGVRDVDRRAPVERRAELRPLQRRGEVRQAPADRRMPTIAGASPR